MAPSQALLAVYGSGPSLNSFYESPCCYQSLGVTHLHRRKVDFLAPNSSSQ
jgi:hypothetical protein